MIKREDVLSFLEEDFNLPSPLNVVTKLSNIIEQQDASASDVAGVIQYDPSLTGKLLKLSNSAAFRGSTAITCIEDAVLRIGFRRIKTLVLSLSLIDTFPKCNILDQYKFWKHSLSTAFTAEMIAQSIVKLPPPYDDFYVTGLLHDLGVLVLDQFTPETYLTLRGELIHSKSHLSDLERQHYGIDHAELGACMLRKWNLPDTLITATKLHHESGEAIRNHSLQAKILHLANFACNKQSLFNSIENEQEALYTESGWRASGLPISDIPSIVEYVTQKIEQVSAILEVVKAS
ncbi:MAG: hypothetical protein A2Y14_03295 [Verrucomicrobia bacterium GWF2_51_19]|nr:MAG: hypothetical protein A2Y14_03295 [Verrucomicrobia bacterium GWF2_51_19]HCJ11753.1 hypothetical protein [Opitutae bacterium]